MPAPLSATFAPPSVDRLLKLPQIETLLAAFGHRLVVDTIRETLDDMRKSAAPDFDAGAIAQRVSERLDATLAPSQRPVFNLTGTVLHTNLGRAPLPRAAIDAAVRVMGQASNLEYELDAGRRGERDAHVESRLTRLTGAQAATVVNNNAAAVFLVLNTLAARKEVIVSRGELIEIGGAFRIPDIMARAGCRLREVGTTNRTHLRDYEDAIGPRTAAIMKVHTSNYAVQGFTAAVAEDRLAELARARGLPLLVDLGSGTLIDLAQYGLPHEPTPQETLARGASIVTFSGDKLLGGPQAGMIVGDEALVARIRKNPLKRALRVDKVTLAVLEAVLRLYSMPERLAQELPALRLLTRPLAEIAALAGRVQPALARTLDGLAQVATVPCRSQIGSGSLPVDLLPSVALSITPAGKRSGSMVERIARAFRALPVPVVGRVADGSLLFDLRCLEDEAGFVAQLAAFAAPAP
ncbi:MAG TPA: L-seryl-tRNA(Sec) selenium transferase [Burkholderiales bacterium]|nr:L-seryl-tRNA(Sec) selenium transferase [Burkholderiales bacterium]